MINRLLTRNTRLWTTVLAFSVSCSLFTSCEKDILEGQPEWLGNSIYERLQEGIEVDGNKETFNTMLRIIDELEQDLVLSKTGSRTLFVASDAAFENWFSTNNWGVRSYAELNTNQKKSLLYNAMVNNAYLLSLMSNVPSESGPPQQGLCMRRQTSAGVFDTIYTFTPDEMPENALNDPKKDVWARFREKGKTLKMLKDNTTPTMIHFLPKFMQKNNITSKDLEIISNGRSTSNLDSWINGRKVISQEQTCKNGYIYVVDDVVEPNKNMAQLITDNKKSTLWAKMMNRYSVPLPDLDATKRYNDLYNTTDTLYVLRYFSDWTTWSGVKGKLKSMIYEQDTIVSPGTLLFDPGWNQYMYSNQMGFDIHYDAGAMIVPTDEAVLEWWKGAGRGLQQEYQSLDSVPLKTLSKLIRVHMLPSFIESVPSKFNTIVDDAKVPLEISPENVVECEMGCNGVVYYTNKVFPPSEYRSVIYPALARESLMGAIYDAVDRCDFLPYLISMDTVYSMILPFNTSASIGPLSQDTIFMQYLDPCSYGMPFQMLYEFYYDPTLQRTEANAYPVKVDEAGNFERKGNKYGVGTALVENRLKDLVDNIIIVGSLNPKQKYYKTKAGSTIRVDYQDDAHVTFAGGWQQETGRTIPSIAYYDMVKETDGNGVSYAVKEVPMTTPKSLYQILQEHAKEDKDCTCAADSAYRVFFDLFADITTSTSLVSKSVAGNLCAYKTYNCKLFDNYNYSVYVPTNESLRKMIADGILPTWDDYSAAKTTAEKNKIADMIHNFVRYHVQDNSIYIGGAMPNRSDQSLSGTDQFETAKINDVTHRFYAVTVHLEENSLSVKDLLKREAHVLTSDEKLYNIPCREYWSYCPDGQSFDKSMTLKASSHAVVHLIDGALLYQQAQLEPWKSRL